MSLSSEVTLTRDEVRSRIDELESDDATEYEVVRVRNDEVLETFADESDAEQYIDDEDYDTSRVVVREAGGLDEDDRQELADLRSFDREALNDVSDWRYGATLYNSDLFDNDDARRLVTERREFDPYEFPFSLINWSEVRDELTDRAGGQYATLSGVQFYDFSYAV